VSRARRWYWRSGAAPIGAPGDGTSHSRALVNRVGAFVAPVSTTQRLLPELNGAAPISALHCNTDAPGGIAGEALRFATAFVSDPLAAQTIPVGAWRVKALTGRSSAYASISMVLCLYLWDPVGQAVRAQIHDRLFLTPSFESINQGVVDFRIPGLQASAEAGDLLVCEVWWAFYSSGSATGPVWFAYDGGADAFGSWLYANTAAYLEAPAPIHLLGIDAPVFDALPDWGTPLVERVRWATDVEVAADGSELRQMLRTVPDRFLTLHPLAPDPDRAATLSALLLSGQLGYRLPWWPDAERLATPLVAGAGAIATPGQDATLRRYTADGQAVLLLDDGTYEVVDLTAVSDAALTLDAGQPTRDWAAGAWVAPLLRATLVDSVSVHRAARFTSEADLTFQLGAIATPAGEPASPEAP